MTEAMQQQQQQQQGLDDCKEQDKVSEISSSS